jgi:phage I-like protein
MKNASRLAFFDSIELGDTKQSAQTPPMEFMLFKFGRNEFTKDGKRGEFEFSEPDADTAIKEFETRGKDLVIDYDHQTLKGGKAPAAGWIEKLIKTKNGLAAKVKYWTSEAARHLENGEYRYSSPVIQFSRRAKSILGIHSVALTNHPALHNNPALVADDTSADADSFSNSPVQEMNLNEIKSKKIEKGFLMKELLTMLGVASFADSSHEEQFNAISEAVSELVELKDKVSSFLKFHNSESIEELSERIDSLPEKNEKLQEELRKKDAEAIVAKAFADGKLAESHRKWAEHFAEKNPEAFEDWLNSAPPIMPDNKNLGDLNKVESSAKFNDQELKVFRNLGLSESQIQNNIN